MTAVQVEDVREAVSRLALDRVIVGQVAVLIEVALLVEADGGDVRREHVQVDGLTRTPIDGRQVRDEIVEQERRDPVASKLLYDAQTQDVGHLRVGGEVRRQNTLILLITLGPRFDFGYDEPDDGMIIDGRE